MTTRTYLVTGIRRQEIDEYQTADSPQAAAAAFRDAHGFLPEAVESGGVCVEVMGACEFCLSVILDGDPHGRTADDLKTCSACSAGASR